MNDIVRVVRKRKIKLKLQLITLFVVIRCIRYAHENKNVTTNFFEVI